MDIKDIVLFSTIFFILANTVSRFVMAEIGDNKPNNCPKVAGPIFVCILYAIGSIGLGILTFLNRNVLSTVNFTLAVLLSLLSFGLSIAFIPFIVESNKNINDKKECLTDANLKAINYMEPITMICLVSFISIVKFF